MRVEVQLDGNWREAEICHVNKNNTIGISYVNAKGKDCKIQTNLRLSDNDVRYLRSDNKYKVEVRVDKGAWVEGRICRMHSNGSCDVKLNKGAVCEVKKEVMFGSDMRYQRRAEIYRVGTFVEIHHPESRRWTRACVCKVDRGSLDVSIGPTAERKKGECLTVEMESVRLPLHCMVEGFIGNGRWAAATVEKVHTDRKGRQTFGLRFSKNGVLVNDVAAGSVRLANVHEMNPWEPRKRANRRSVTSDRSHRDTREDVELRVGLAVSVHRPDSSLTWQGVVQSKRPCGHAYAVLPLAQHRRESTCKRSWLRPIYCEHDMFCKNRYGCHFYHSPRARRLLQCSSCQRRAAAYTDRDTAIPPFFGPRRLGHLSKACPLTVLLTDICNDDERQRLHFVPVIYFF